MGAMPNPAPSTANLGEDGYVLLRAYLPLADSMWFTAGCGRCGRTVPISVAAAVAMLPAPGATVGWLNRRLRCSSCGNRRVSVTICPDVRSAEAQQRDGPLPETRAGVER